MMATVATTPTQDSGGSRMAVSPVAEGEALVEQPEGEVAAARSSTAVTARVTSKKSSTIHDVAREPSSSPAA